MKSFDGISEICRQNALECETRMERDFVSRRSHVGDMLSLYGKKLSGQGSEAIRLSYADFLSDTGCRCFDPASVGGLVSLYDGAAFASEFILPEISELYSEREGGGTVSYYGTPAFKRAFSLFSERIDGLTGEYAGSFEESCEAVYSSRADFCILPVENQRDGMLSGFRRLIDRYELNAAMLCSDDPDGEGEVVFALLCRAPEFFPERPGPGERYITLSVTLREERTLSRLLAASSLLSAKFVKADCLPDGYFSVPRQTYLITFAVDGGPQKLLNWLTLEGCGFRIFGIYDFIRSLPAANN